MTAIEKIKDEIIDNMYQYIESSCDNQECEEELVELEKKLDKLIEETIKQNEKEK